VLSAVSGVGPAIPRIGRDDAAPAGEDVMGEDEGSATRHDVGEQTLARGEHRRSVAVGHDPVRMRDLTRMVEHLEFAFAADFLYSGPILIVGPLRGATTRG